MIHHGIEFTLRWDGDAHPASLVSASVLPRRNSVVKTPMGENGVVIDEIWDFTGGDTNHGEVTILLAPVAYQEESSDEAEVP